MTMLDGLSSLSKKFGKRKGHGRHGCHHSQNGEFCPNRVETLTLADIRPGNHARVTGFCAGIPANRKAHLQAYGLVPGYWVRVIQHSPVTIVQIEHTELAMELSLACEIQVKPGQPAS